MPEFPETAAVLRQAMSRRGLSVRDLKREMGWGGSIGSIYVWLSGRSKPRVDTRKKLAETLRISQQTLERADEMPTRRQTSDQEVPRCPHFPHLECPEQCWHDLPAQACLHDR